MQREKERLGDRARDSQTDRQTDRESLAHLTTIKWSISGAPVTMA